MDDQSPMNPISFLTDTIRIETGGFASLWQLARTISRSGQPISLIMIRFDPSFSRNLIRLNTKSPDSHVSIIYAPGLRSFLGNSYKETLSSRLTRISRFAADNGLKHNLKAFIEWGLFRLWSSSYREALQKLRESKVILKAASLSGGELAGLRAQTTSRIIQNHAGSPDAYEQYWIKKRHVPPGSDPGLSNYVNFCLGFDFLLFQSTEQGLLCAERHPMLRERILTLLPSSDETTIDAAMEYPSPYPVDRRTLVNVGTLQPRKDQMSSIYVFKALSEYHQDVDLHFIGGWRSRPGYYAELLEEVRVNGLEGRVFFHGHRDDYLRYMCHADIILQTSKAEGVSRVLREAMYMQVPIVAFNISGTNELLRQDTDALLVKPEDISGMEEGISKLLRDKTAANQLIRSALERYSRCYSQAVYRDNAHNIFTSLSAGEH